MNLTVLQNDLYAALKQGKSFHVQTLRLLISAVRNGAIAKYGSAWEASITEADILDVVKKQIKTHKESIEAFSAAGRTDLVTKEQGELDVLQEYAPKELSDAEIQALIAPVAQSGESNFGLLMKQAMAAVKGQADGSRVSRILRSLLDSSGTK